MKKTWVFAVVLLLLITGSSWGVQTTDFLNEHVVCLDSIPGTQGECDSAHVYVLFGNADYPCYMARTTDCGGSWIDSIDYAGRLHASYRFFDQVADCDCDSGAGKYEVIVTLFGSGVPTENSFSFELIDGNFNDLLMTMEPQTNRKNVYVKVDSSATNDGTSWDNACSIYKAVANCTGADEYYVYVAPGTYTEVELDITVGSSHWIGGGIGSTILYGKQDVASGLGAHYAVKFNATDSAQVEFTGFTVQSYVSTTGEYDSVTHWGVYPMKSKGWHVHDNVIRGFYYGIQTCGGSWEGRFENNRILHTVAVGMRLEGGHGDWFVDNVIDSMVNDGAIGIDLSSTSHNNFFLRNIVNMNKGQAVKVASGCDRNVFADMYLKADGDSAIVDAGTLNTWINVHRRSQISDPQTIEEDIYSIDTKVNDMWGVTEPNRNRLNLYVSTNGSDDSSGLTWQAAVLTLRVAEFKCTGADEYYIYVAPGTYASTSCTTETANVHWVGAGRDRVLLSGTVGKPVMMITGDGVTMSGFRLTGGNDTWLIDGAKYFEIYDCFSQQDNINDAMWIMDDAHYGRVYNNYFRGGNMFTGFNVQGDGNLFYDNVIDSAKAAGILFGGTAAWNQVMNNYVNAIGTGQGIKHGNSDPANNFFAGNYVYAETDGNDYAEPYSDGNFYVGNQGRSWRFEQDTATSVQDDFKSLAISITPDDGFGVVDTVCTTTMVRDSTNFVDVIDDFYNGLFLQFTTGQNKGLVRLIEDFRNYGEFILHPALPYAPAETDEFRIMSLVVGERRPNIIRIVD